MNSIHQNCSTQPIVDEIDMWNGDNVSVSVSPHVSAVDYYPNPTPILDNFDVIKAGVSLNKDAEKLHNSVRMMDFMGEIHDIEAVF